MVVADDDDDYDYEFGDTVDLYSKVKIKKEAKPRYVHILGVESVREMENFWIRLEL